MGSGEVNIGTRTVCYIGIIVGSTAAVSLKQQRDEGHTLPFLTKAREPTQFWASLGYHFWAIPIMRLIVFGVLLYQGNYLLGLKMFWPCFCSSHTI